MKLFKEIAKNLLGISIFFTFLCVYYNTSIRYWFEVVVGAYIGLTIICVIISTIKQLKKGYKIIKLYQKRK